MGIEDKISVTNKTKGKGGIVLGKTLMCLSLIPPAIPIIEYFNSQSLDTENLKNTAIAGGVIAGVGAVTYLYGKIKHWYWNK